MVKYQDTCKPKNPNLLNFYNKFFNRILDIYYEER